MNFPELRAPTSSDPRLTRILRLRSLGEGVGLHKVKIGQGARASLSDCVVADISSSASMPDQSSIT